MSCKFLQFLQLNESNRTLNFFSAGIAVENFDQSEWVVIWMAISSLTDNRFKNCEWQHVW